MENPYANNETQQTMRYYIYIHCRQVKKGYARDANIPAGLDTCNAHASLADKTT